MINPKTTNIKTAATIQSICARVIFLGNKLVSKGITDTSVNFSWSSSSNSFDIQLCKWDGDECIDIETHLWYSADKFDKYSLDDIYKALEEWEKRYELE